MKLAEQVVLLAAIASIAAIMLPVSSSATPPSGTPPESSATWPSAAAEERYGRGASSAANKLGPALSRLKAAFTAHEALLAADPRIGEFRQSDPDLRLVDGRVVIDAAAADDAEALLAAMKELGLEGGARYGRVVSGMLPIAALDGLSRLTELEFARPSYPRLQVGAVTSQGDVATEASVTRPTFGVDGTGITVGVLSDSYDCIGGAAADIASGDLPAELAFLTDSPCAGSDEGRAMMQLVYDMAPGSALGFHTAFSGKADFALGIEELATLGGADVIVDDVIYLDEPMFQDGVVAQAVDNVAGMGVAYFSSAGNQARQSYEDAYRPSGLTPAGVGFDSHDFDATAGTDALQEILLETGEGITVGFQWDDPFFSVSGAPGAATDLDIFLMEATGTAVVASSTTANIGADPFELISFTNVGPAASFNVVIEHVAGPAPTRVKYIDFRGDYTALEYDTGSSTIFGHANAAGAEAIAAASYSATPPFGTSPPVLESFSSAGPTDIIFDKFGTRLGAPVTRPKPELTCVDGTDNTFFGFDSEPNGFPNFFGTSAAAPHAAGIAALMLEINPGLRPSQIYAYLELGAIDMDDPSTAGFDVGYDFASGFGLCNAVAAAGSADACGDGIPAGPREQCDDGNPIDGDGCDINCTFTACGNGIATSGEQCDDGNLDDHDGCRNNCIFPIGTAGVPFTDDFNECTLTGLLSDGWTLTDTLGTAATQTIAGGAPSPDAFLRFMMPPAATDYDAWNGTSTNDALRLMQSTPAIGDFEVEARFLSVPVDGIDDQGFLFETDADTFLRVDTYRTDATADLMLFVGLQDGTTRHIEECSATTSGCTVGTSINFAIPVGSAEYMRVARDGTGHNWGAWTSADGMSWVRRAIWNTTDVGGASLTVVNSMGIYGGNPPAAQGAYTADFDYFRNVESPWSPAEDSETFACATCGNGFVDTGEECDDGNADGTDGCSTTCSIELGFDCPTPGEPCTPVCVDTPLFTGWNMIGEAVDLATDAASLCQEVVGGLVEVDRYVDGGWEAHVCGLPFNNFSIEAGSGYFVIANGPSIWCQLAASITSPLDISLELGWNAFSLPAWSEGWTAEGLCLEIDAQGGTAREIDRYVNGGWESHVCGLPFNDFQLQPTTGYFVLVDAASALQLAATATPAKAGLRSTTDRSRVANPAPSSACAYQETPEVPWKRSGSPNDPSGRLLRGAAELHDEGGAFR